MQTPHIISARPSHYRPPTYASGSWLHATSATCRSPSYPSARLAPPTTGDRRAPQLVECATSATYRWPTNPSARWVSDSPGAASRRRERYQRTEPSWRGGPASPSDSWTCLWGVEGRWWWRTAAHATAAHTTQPHTLHGHTHNTAIHPTQPHTQQPYTQHGRTHNTVVHTTQPHTQHSLTQNTAAHTTHPHT